MPGQRLFHNGSLHQGPLGRRSLHCQYSIAWVHDVVVVVVLLSGLRYLYGLDCKSVNGLCANIAMADIEYENLYTPVGGADAVIDLIP